MYRKLALALLFFSIRLIAQDLGSDSLGIEGNRAIKATEFAIPSSPAFIMLNNNSPSRIERYASLHDIKVDWSVFNGQQGYAINPGLGIEIQPVWMFFFDRAAAAKYRRASPFVRSLTTLSLSAATNGNDKKNWLTWAGKINLYRRHDPLADSKFLREIEKTTKSSKDSILLIARKLNRSMARLNRRAKNYQKRFDILTDSIALIKSEIRQLEREQKQQLLEVRDDYIEKNWNASYLDFAFGQLFSYEQTQIIVSKTFESPTIPGQIDTVSFVTRHHLKTRRQGYSVWLSGGLGLGDFVMFSGMLRYGKKPSLFTDTTGTQFSIGSNLRYGNHRYNFFIEAFYDREKYPILSGSLETIRQQLYLFTIGGDWRIGRNVMLSFGIRQTKDFDTGAFLLQPLFNITCLMR